MPAVAAMPVVSAAEARRLLLGAQGLLADPARPATPARVCREIEQMGFVQVDTINVVERAHHHILRTRFDGYEPRMLAKLLERDRKLFEHWTHDASIIPTSWLPFWRLRFDRYRRHGHPPDSFWSRRMGGNPQPVIEHVLGRIDREGPLMSRDFEHEGARGESSWWGWKPQKAALEYLWRIGEISVTRREAFHKVYDRTERVLPEASRAIAPDADTHRDWACRSALERLGVATPGELAAFVNAISIADARVWCQGAPARGDAVEVLVESANGAKPRRAYAHPDWRRRARREPARPRRLRLLSPFDPVIRDRKRAERLFGFDYRFEAFVPAPKRQYGYYVMPILEGERFVGRLDPKLHRDRGVLEVRGLWWEPTVKATATRRRALDSALGRFARTLGADRVDVIARAR